MKCDTTRLSTAEKLGFEELEGVDKHLGSGTYGSVHKRVDRRSGKVYAVKQVTLGNPKAVENSLNRFRLEIEIMQMLNHPNIIPFLDHQHLATRRPQFRMPIRDGNLRELVDEIEASSIMSLCNSVLTQMLMALDYTANNGVIHRDLKPSNILYYRVPNNTPGKGPFCFQLADFGLAQYTVVAESLNTFNIGTLPYMAPELCPSVSKVKARQSPKVDIWSLFATMVAIRSRCTKFPPPKPKDYAVILDILRAEDVKSLFGPMGRLNPRCRASAAQMLKYFFHGEGLTTPPSEIPEIEPTDEADETDENDETEIELSSSPLSSNSQQTENDDGSTLRQPNAVALEFGSALQTENNSGGAVRKPSAVFPSASRPRRTPTAMNRLNKSRQPQPSRSRGAGVAKRTASPRAARATSLYSSSTSLGSKPRRSRKPLDVETPSRSMSHTSGELVSRHY
ncbi:kinase-like domain-containing protein [Nemania sp. FL0031]|nr:kinase-like domain-containing protein [Nemania sp. FL0031]